MTPEHDEFVLYMTDRATWAERVAPRWKALLQATSGAEKEELWRLAGPELRAAIRRLARSTDLTSPDA